MKKLLDKIKDCAGLITSIKNCEKQITPILQGFITNFPDYTDHSINHSKSVLNYAELMLSKELNKLNEDEVYILIMAGFLHDIGMCPTSKMKTSILESNEFIESNKSFENFLRDIHHVLSFEYITTHWEKLGIVNETYAYAIGLVGMGHRVTNLLNFEEYNPEFIVKSGTEYVCLPYLAAIIRIADELDITNDRTPDLLFSEYLPENVISKKEWNKHKANYFVNFRRQTIKITAKCSDKDIYYALLKHYNKIEDVIKYVQKVVLTLPTNDRNLKIHYIKLDKDIQTIGFIPKNIGFTFDLQNTINTFIGTNIYHNKFVAIRECLQNAIDSCRLKIHLNNSHYKPELNVTLKDNSLIISDNGIGMDEFITTNYFAKLSKSYYSENKISNEFEAISQFGVGVFSYFLLCDYFDVETKQESKETLNFRVTKLAENYFYFFDSSNRNTTGTTIRMHLSEEIGFNELVKQIKHYVRFLNFPINVSSKDEQRVINSEKFELDKLNYLEKFDRQKKKNLKDIVIIDAEFSDENCEGVLGLIMLEENNTFVPFNIGDSMIFKNSRTCKIEVSQKGIFLGDFGNENMYNVIGKINLKQKNEIDLGRYNIKNRKLIDELNINFYKIIFKKVFDNWKDKTPEIKYKLSLDFLKYYFTNNTVFVEGIITLLYNDIFVEVYDGNKCKYISIKETFDFENFILLKKETPFGMVDSLDEINYSEIFKQVNCPLVIDKSFSSARILHNFFRVKKCLIRVVGCEKHWFYKISPEKVATTDDRKSLVPGPLSSAGSPMEAYNFDNMHICANTNIFFETPLNLKNDIVNFYFKNLNRIEDNQGKTSIYFKLLLEIGTFFGHFHTIESTQKSSVDEINYFNSILNKINEIYGTRFKLTQQDFSSWMNDKIKWDQIE